LANRELRRREIAGAVRVAVERERDAETLRLSGKRCRKIEARGLTVDLQRGAGARGRRENGVVIELVAGRLIEAPSGGMPDDVDVRVLTRE
jgi:phage terminase Nu1 subunit (DNA packaging protein)